MKVTPITRIPQLPNHKRRKKQTKEDYKNLMKRDEPDGIA